MQNRYFGDVGDYGKYGLLRFLCGIKAPAQLRLGVIWYLYPDESHNRDGKHLGYLRDASYRACDETLYDSLHSGLFDPSGTLRPNGRSIETLASMGILPPDTVYYSAPLSFLSEPSVTSRRKARKDWFDGALAKTASAELIFVDPDNGIECKSVSRFSKKGPKYVYWDDLQVVIERGQSLVIYHHLNRSATHSAQVDSLLDEIRRRFPDRQPMATLFRRGSGRAYFIIPSQENHSLLRKRLESFSLGEWKYHFVTRLPNEASTSNEAGLPDED